MGIFSLFGKKDRPPADTLADKDSSRKKREETAARTDAGRSSSRESTAPDKKPGVNRDVASDAELTQQVQRKAAQATTMKIDAIESEMSSEFVKPMQSPGKGRTEQADTRNTAAGVLIRVICVIAERREDPDTADGDPFHHNFAQETGAVANLFFSPCCDAMIVSM